jgi:glycosyltransferase involved in cell wall biosynthesis
VDGLPNTLLEGLASGTPIVTTNAGGIGSVVEHDRNALVVTERDARGLADAIHAILADADRRSRLGREGRSLVERSFGWDAAAARFEAAYDRALAFKSLAR